MGTRNNHSPPRRSFASQKLLNVNSPRHTNNPPHQCGPHYLASGKYHANGPQWETKKTRSVFQFLWLKLTPSLQYLSGWWLNQPHWKICSSKRVHLPQIGVKFKKNETTTYSYNLPVAVHLYPFVESIRIQYPRKLMGWKPENHPGLIRKIIFHPPSFLSPSRSISGGPNLFVRAWRLVGHGWATKCKITPKNPFVCPKNPLRIQDYPDPFLFLSDGIGTLNPIRSGGVWILRDIYAWNLKQPFINGCFNGMMNQIFT